MSTTTRQRPPSVMAARRRANRTPNSMVASAALITARSPKGTSTPQEWQKRAWDYYDEVGELRFGAGWLANAMSRVNLIAAVPPQNPGDAPVAIDPEAEDVTPDQLQALEIVKGIAGGIAGHGALMHDCALQLTVPGVGYIWTTPDDDDQFSTWRVMSNEEVKPEGQAIKVAAQNEDGSDAGWQVLGESDVLIKVWRPHPRKATQPDSPVRAVLGSLGQITMFDRHIEATGETRLTGNGLLVMPEEAVFPPNQGVMPDDDDPDEDGERSGDDDFLETLMLTMEAAESGNERARRTPLMVRVPGEFAEFIKHITFSTPFDDKVEGLREAAVKRVALGLDMPPEVLLGLGDTNHWSAWQIAEEAITLQVEPMAEIVCHALTKFYLRAALAAAGLEPGSVIVWYDTTDLRTRPDRSESAKDAYDRDELTGEAYVREAGLNPDDRPSKAERAERILLRIAEGNPEAALPILAALGYLDDLEAPLTITIQPRQNRDAIEAPATDEDGGGERALPERDSEPPDSETAALIAAADGLVFRALEKGGQRLRSAMARERKCDTNAIECADVAALHCSVAATQYASIEHLLAGAWDRVPRVAARHRVSPEALTAALHSYTAALIAAGNEHDEDRLADALGASTL